VQLLEHLKFRRLLLASLAVALLTFLMQWLAGTGNVSIGTAVKGSAIFSLLWTAIVVLSFIKFKRRGLWLLLGMPFTFYWIFLLFLIAYRCGHDVKACTS
jgi:hypothetical protein